MCDFANMGGGYGQRFQQFEQNHPQFQKAWSALSGGVGGPQQSAFQWLPQGAHQNQAPVVPPSAMAQPVAPVRGGATSA